MKYTDAQIEQVKRDHPCDQVAAKWVRLRKHGRKMVGPCPIHSPDRQAKDSTSFECEGEGWVCASCNDGGDVIRLVMRVENIEFVAAVQWLGGVREIDAEAELKAEAERQAKVAKRDRDSEWYRERERTKMFFRFWRNAMPIEGTAGEDYLRLRGIPALPPSVKLRFLPDLEYWIDGGKNPTSIHGGPALLAPIKRGGKFSALHMTYLDLAQPKGKLALVHPEDGSKLDAKKVRGSKAGGHIELVMPAEPKYLFIGEGIEKVLAVWYAMEITAKRPPDVPSHQAYWTSVDLGNLGGKAAETVPHPERKTGNGRAARVPGPVPDLAAPGIEIPESVECIVILRDSSSDAFLTDCAIARAAARWARDGRTILVARSPADCDYDDMLRGLEPGSAGLMLAVCAIVEIIDAASAVAVPAVRVMQHETKTDGSAGRPQSLPSLEAVAAASHPAPEAPNPPINEEREAVAALAAAPPPLAGGFGAPPSQPGGTGISGDDDGGGGPQDLDLKLAYFTHTDLGNAERFVARNKGRFLWSMAMGWLWWDGKRWARDGADGKVRIAAHACIRAIQDEARALRSGGGDKVAKVINAGKPNETALTMADLLAMWGRDCETNTRLSKLAEQAQPYLEVAAEELDADPLKINCANGTIVVRRVRDGDCIAFRPHDPNDRITKVTPVNYDPNATCPLYDDFLSFVQPKIEVHRFLHQWGGLSLTGDISEQVLVFFWGKGKNGKSTLLSIWCHVAGDYSRTVPIETFINEGRSRSAGQATPDLAMLQGRRLVQASEPDRGAKLSEALIKLITGGDIVPVRFLNKEYFDLVPQFKLTISGNYKPRIEGADEGIWRRVILVPWGVMVPVEKRDKGLVDKLKGEASGVLNRMLDGLRDWLDTGLVPAEDVIKATAEYRRDSDPLGRFLDACVVVAAGERVQSSIMHSVFVAWARANSATEWSAKGLAAALKERGFESHHSDVNWWLNVKLTKTSDDFVDHEGKPRQRNGDGSVRAPEMGGDDMRF